MHPHDLIHITTQLQRWQACASSKPTRVLRSSSDIVKDGHSGCSRRYSVSRRACAAGPSRQPRLRCRSTVAASPRALQHTEIKLLISKGDEATNRAEEYYKEAGRRLADLQRHKPEDVTWEDYVKQKCGISCRRADELIEIWSGRKTLEDSRARKRESMARSREQARAPRGAGPTQTDIEDAIASLDHYDDIAKSKKKKAEEAPGQALSKEMRKSGVHEHRIFRARGGRGGCAELSSYL